MQPLLGEDLLMPNQQSLQGCGPGGLTHVELSFEPQLWLWATPESMRSMSGAQSCQIPGPLAQSVDLKVRGPSIGFRAGRNLWHCSASQRF